jgi:hypothetical protein
MKGQKVKIKNEFGEVERFYTFDSFDRFSAKEHLVALAFKCEPHEPYLYAIIEHPSKNKKTAHQLYLGHENLIVLMRWCYDELDRRTHRNRGTL